MMTPQTISAPEFELERRRNPRMVSRYRRFALIAVLLSVCVHLAVVLLIVLLPRLLPGDIRPQEQGTIEFVLLEQKGAESNKGGQPIDSKPPPPRKPESPQEEAKTTSTQPGAPTVADPVAQPPGDEPAPPRIRQMPPEATKTDAPPAAKQDPAQSAAPATQTAPLIDLRDAAGDFDAIISGDHVIPAIPDSRFRNRPPDYPAEAAMKGQHGSVVIVIHVGGNGLVTGIEVRERSGIVALDQAAVAAARKWRFRPAMKDGRAIPSDFPFRFIFGDD